MNEKAIKALLTGVGIGGATITLLLAVNVGVTIYKNYFEIQNLRRNIVRLNQLIANDSKGS